MRSVGAETFGAGDLMTLLESQESTPVWHQAHHLALLESLGDAERYSSFDERLGQLALLPGPDGTLHASYSYNLETIKHVHFNEAWVQAGD